MGHEAGPLPDLSGSLPTLARSLSTASSLRRTFGPRSAGFHAASVRMIAHGALSSPHDRAEPGFEGPFSGWRAMAAHVPGAGSEMHSVAASPRKPPLSIMRPLRLEPVWSRYVPGRSDASRLFAANAIRQGHWITIA